MRFKRRLIHRCTLINPNQEIGKDEYNRPIYEDVSIPNILCRADQIKKRVSNDDHGVDIIVENILFFAAEQEIKANMKVHSIMDRKGNPVLPGLFGIQNVNPIYRRVSLHHYEVTLQKESDSSG